MGTINLREEKHPNPLAKERYENLLGLASHKSQLLHSLQLIFKADGFLLWKNKHHPSGFPFLTQVFKPSPLIILSGEVGCGKTELASCIGTPLVDELGGKTVRVFETPSDIRGTGAVGELSARIAAAFGEAKRMLKKGEKGILIFDEADDLATGRDQEQAHHEDRAGVNALIKELDGLEKDQAELAVIFITNRSGVMDPAILRRASIEINFQRPGSEEVREVLEHILSGLPVTPAQLTQLAHICKPKPFTYSDLFRKVAYQTLITAQDRDEPFSLKLLQETIEVISPTPQFKKS